MNKIEIENILKKCMELQTDDLEPPTSDDWNELEKKIKHTFSETFKNFIELMIRYEFPGEIYNVSNERNNGDDPIDFVYEFEMKSGDWVKNMLPFYGLGNGDYFCLCISNNDNEKVYFYDHTDKKMHFRFDSFDNWVLNLTQYLSWNLQE